MDKKGREFGEALRSLENTPPPDGLKAQILNKLMDNPDMPELNPVQRLLFRNPLGAAGVLSVAISGLLWAILGNNYPALVNALLFSR
jgi:hypothetical protein